MLLGAEMPGVVYKIFSIMRLFPGFCWLFGVTANDNILNRSLGEWTRQHIVRNAMLSVLITHNHASRSRANRRSIFERLSSGYLICCFQSPSCCVDCANHQSTADTCSQRLVFPHETQVVLPFCWFLQAYSTKHSGLFLVQPRVLPTMMAASNLQTFTSSYQFAMIILNHFFQHFPTYTNHMSTSPRTSRARISVRRRRNQRSALRIFAQGQEVTGPAAMRHRHVEDVAGHLTCQRGEPGGHAASAEHHKVAMINHDWP